MKLLIFTQKVNQDDPVLGFMCSWIKEFAKNCEKVTIICLEKGKYQLPPNVKILSLGKEEGHSKLKYLLRFYLYIWRERKNYDVIFSHMNPEYIIFGGFLWRFWKKKISLWYAHGFASLGLKIAEKLVDIIFTSTRSGCRLSSSKIKIVGQGIDTNFFKPPTEVLSKKTGVFNLISIGRISPIKNYGLLVKALEKLKGELLNIKAIIIGSPILPKDYLYLEFLNREIKQKKLNKDIIFLGSLPNDKILPHLYSANLFINISHTGSLDKAMLEAMAVGLPVLTCNEAMLDVFGDLSSVLMYPKNDFLVLAEKIKMIKELSNVETLELSSKLRTIVLNNHSLEKFIKKIIFEIKQNV